MDVLRFKTRFRERRASRNLGRILTPEQIAEIRSYFEDIPCLNRHEESAPYGDENRQPFSEARNFPYGTWTREEIMRSPHLIGAVASSETLAAVEAFLGARTKLCSVNAYWSFPHKGGWCYRQDFFPPTRRRFCALFLYLADAGECRAGTGILLHPRKVRELHESTAPCLMAFAQYGVPGAH